MQMRFAEDWKEYQHYMGARRGGLLKRKYFTTFNSDFRWGRDSFILGDGDDFISAYKYMLKKRLNTDMFLKYFYALSSSSRDRYILSSH